MPLKKKEKKRTNPGTKFLQLHLHWWELVSIKFLGARRKFLIFWVEEPGELPICPLAVQPLSAEEDGGDAAGRVGDLHTVEQPAGTQTTVVVFYAHLQQLPHIQHLQQEAVCLLALKKIAELLPQLPAARITISTVDGEKDVGVGTRRLLVASDDNDLVLDGHQAAGLAGEALHGL